MRIFFLLFGALPYLFWNFKPTKLSNKVLGTFTFEVISMRETLSNENEKKNFLKNSVVLTYRYFKKALDIRLQRSIRKILTCSNIWRDPEEKACQDLFTNTEISLLQRHDKNFLYWTPTELQLAKVFDFHNLHTS